MPTRTTPTPRRALAAAAAVLVLGAGGLVTATPAGAQTDPVPSTEPVPTTTAEAPATSTTAVEEPGADDAAVEDAQDQADADLRSVWVIVAALGAVAVGLLVLLVLYVRATNPERAARRRAELVTRAEERRRSRGADDEDDEFRAFDAAADDTADRTELVGAVPAAGPAPTLSRDPEGTDADAVRVLGGAPVAASAPGSTAVPESISPPVTTGTGAGTRRRATPLKAAPVGPRPGPAGPPPGPAEGDETVRIVPAPSGPAAVPASAGRGAVVTAGPGAAVGDRPPPRSLVDSPPPPRRPRRVDAPAKKLGTPDAERVLVRPGQTPVRVPPSLSRPDPAAAGDAPVDVPADDEASTEEPGR